MAALKLARLKSDRHYRGVDFSSVTLFLNPVIAASKLGADVDYGRLFAYLFRRFGYPNCGWDDYKELACYLLATPHPQMLMKIVPYVGNDASISIRFLVEHPTASTFDDFGRRHRDAWRTAALDHQERTGLPAWMPQWVERCKDQILPRLGTWIPDNFGWRESAPYVDFDNADDGLAKMAKAFFIAAYELYQAIVPDPGYEERPDAIAEWSDEDPLKPFALAAVAALNDLLRPVRVRDHAITAHGEVAPTGRTLKESGVAGYPSGALGNADPKGFAALHGLIVTLGKGNEKRGVAKALAILSGQDKSNSRI